MNLERQLIRVELTQRREEGCDTSAIEPRVAAALAAADGADSAPGGPGAEPASFEALYDELAALEPAPSFPYQEPSELEAIRALRPAGPRRMTLPLTDDEMRDRIGGAWLGRAAGCALGKPVEGWPRKRIDAYLEAAGALPLDDYIPFREGAIAPHLKSSTRGNIAGMARDDDLDYPILGLLALESKGEEVTPRNLANTWLGRMPFHLVYTAESAAYRNFVNGRWPPHSATWRNPYREWIGAQIRADVFGWAAPGWPEKAAELAFRDASISHAKNGIYGEMFVAAMLAAAFVTDDVDEIVGVGLSEIPAECRLAEAVRDTLAWCRGESDWETVWNRIHVKYGRYHGVHTINNAALVVMGLAFGARDYERGIVVAVRGGWDTDCNGATVGSVLGARFGASALPEKWTGVLEDRLESCVRGCNHNRISDLAERTFQVAKRMLAPRQAEKPESKAQVSAQSAARDLAGSWRLDLSWGDPVLTVNPDLSGQVAYTAYDEVSKIRDLRVDGDRVRFAFAAYKGETEVDVAFDGRIAGDRLAGECVSGGFEFPATAIRVRGAEQP